MSRFTVLGHAADLLFEAADQTVSAAWSDARGSSGTAHLERRGERLWILDDLGKALDGPLRVVFSLHEIPCFVECTAHGSRIEGPVALWSDERRTTRRFQIDGFACWWEITPTGLQSRTARLMDLGVNGARIHVDPGGAVPPTTGRFPMQLVVDGRLVEALGEVRSRVQDATGEQLGLQVEFRDRASLARLCVRTSLPNVRLRREVPPDEVYRLFADSGYLALREGCVPSERWLGLDADTVSQDLMYLADDGRPVGHVSISRAYGTTWLGHQIVMRRRHPETMRARAALYSAFTMLPTLIDGDSAHLLGYYDRELPWHQLFFTHFVESVGSTDTAVVVPWDRFERRRGAPLPDVPDFAGEVTPIHPYDRVPMLQLARSMLPVLMSDALDLHPRSLVSDALHPAYTAAGIHRSRTGFCLRENGRITAFALCEVTDRGLSLFSLMNLAQVFALPGASPAGQLALQRRVRAFYRDRGLDDVLLVAPEGTFKGELDPEVRLEETMGCIVWSAAGLRAYENFLKLHFEWLEQGRRVELPSTSRPRREAG